jgi:thioredoxin-like negative regulator of GroEL
MELTFNTQTVDVSVALKALKLYREGEFGEATTALLQVLDAEPKNWQARLMLAACYFKTGQLFAAQRAFRVIYDQCADEELRTKALDALQFTNARLAKKTTNTPLEFGEYVARTQPAQSLAIWLE